MARWPEARGRPYWQGHVIVVYIRSALIFMFLSLYLVFGVQWCIFGGTWQSGQIKEFAKCGEAFPTFPFSPLPFLSPSSSSSLDVGPLKQLG